MIWVKYFLNLASSIAERSDAGAVIVSPDHRVLSLGHSDEQHAERNAINGVDRSRLDGATIYISRAPCTDCADFIREVGLLSLVCPEGTVNLNYGEYYLVSKQILDIVENRGQ